MTGNTVPQAFDAESLPELFELLRRRPWLARELKVYHVVQTMAGRWRDAQDVLEVTDEVPMTAWIVRKKAEVLLPPDPGAQAAEPFEPENDTRPGWLDHAVFALQRRWEEALRMHERPVGFRPRVRAPVKNPSPWKLAWAYPQVRVKPSTPPQVVHSEPDPIADRWEMIRAELARRGGRLTFDELPARNPRARAGNFVALVQLWQSQEIELVQTDAFGVLWICAPGAPRP